MVNLTLLSWNEEPENQLAPHKHKKKRNTFLTMTKLQMANYLYVELRSEIYNGKDSCE
jgi:hypothetical protein